MKKLAVISMIFLFALSFVFSTGVKEMVENGSLVLPVVEEETVQEEEVKAPIEGMKELIILNNAFDGLELSKQVYNAKEWHKCYSLAEIVEANFWFMPADDDDAVTVAFTDFYEDRETAKTFMSKYVSLAKDNEKYDYELFVGMNQKETYDVKYKGYCKVGVEALVFVPEDGWMIDELMEIMPFASAPSYDLVTVSGDRYRVSSEDIIDYEILPEGDGCVVTNGDITIADPLYLIPTGLTPESEVEEGVVSRATVLINANGVYGVDAPYSENRAGVVYSAWSCAELMDKFGVPTVGDVVITSYKDGFTKTISAEEFASLYIAFQAPTSKGDQKDFFTLGRNQERNAGVNNVGSYVFDDASFIYIPDAGLSCADIASETGMAESDEYLITYVNGDSIVISGEEFMALSLSGDSSIVTIEAI
ncbi:MAG: hypothetical protein MSS69_09950 [Spirochaetales bacterium]|nr:hypothetical protein [Spirochaetales bacterium]